MSRRSVTLSPMLVGIILLIAMAVLGLAEWFVYDQELFWDSEKEDPRSFAPSR